MYAVEEEIRVRKLVGDDKLLHRLTHSKPLVEVFFEWVSIPLARSTPKRLEGRCFTSLLGAALLTCEAHVTSIESMSKMIQLRNVPEALHRQLKARAALAGLPLSDYLIREARKLAEYPTPEEMRERLKGRAAYRGKMAASDLVRAERDSR